MTKIAKLEQKTYLNKPNGFTITFDDGRSGNLQEKESDKGLRVGDSVAVTEIPYTSKAGKTSTLYGARLLVTAPSSGITPTPPPPPPPPPSSNIPQTNIVVGMKYDARLKCIQIAHDAFLGGKLDDAEAQNHCRAWVAMSDALIDDLYKK